MIEREGGCLRVTAPMVMSNARTLLAEGRDAFAHGTQVVVDLGAVSEADSAALALMLAWMRSAQARNCKLVFANLPTGVQVLADLYGVAELLPVA